jgi:hypothetical protein
MKFNVPLSGYYNVAPPYSDKLNKCTLYFLCDHVWYKNLLFRHLLQRVVTIVQIIAPITIWKRQEFEFTSVASNEKNIPIQT